MRRIAIAVLVGVICVGAHASTSRVTPSGDEQIDLNTPAFCAHTVEQTGDHSLATTCASMEKASRAWVLAHDVDHALLSRCVRYSRSLYMGDGEPFGSWGIVQGCIQSGEQSSEGG